MEPHLPLLDELLRHLVDVVSFATAAASWSTRQAVDGGPGHHVVDLDLGHLLNGHLPGRAGGRSRVLAPTNHLLLLATRTSLASKLRIAQTMVLR